MIEIIEFNEVDYPALQGRGHASKFAFPFAKEILKDKTVGFDVGYFKPEWQYPGSIGIEPSINPEFDAMNLPPIKVDYFVSSHMLEHYVGRFQSVIEYWLTKLNDNGVIFLYLPNCDYQKYWAWGNLKHIHYLSPSIMKDYCSHLLHNKLIKKHTVTEGYDLNGSFYCIIEK